MSISVFLRRHVEVMLGNMASGGGLQGMGMCTVFVPRISILESQRVKSGLEAIWTKVRTGWLVGGRSKRRNLGKGNSRRGTEEARPDRGPRRTT